MFKRAMSLFAVLALSGCTAADGTAADGEEADENVDSAEEAVVGTACSNQNADAQAVKAAIDAVRTAAGMSALNCNDTIQKGAIAHAKYTALNGGIQTHVEVSGKPGFTGVNFWERMYAAGFPQGTNANAPGGEVIGSGKGSEAITGQYGFMNTVFHRMVFVSFDTKAYGFGNYVSGGTSKYGTIDFSKDFTAPKTTAISTWPKNGANGVLTTFNCATEIPNPCSGLVGYPISISGGDNLTILTHTLKQNGTSVAHTYRSNANDMSFSKQHFFMIPSAPLAKNATYAATVTGKVGNASFSRSWSFTTGSN
jgi:uncharacterized protein YkwD